MIAHGLTILDSTTVRYEGPYGMMHARAPYLFNPLYAQIIVRMAHRAEQGPGSPGHMHILEASEPFNQSGSGTGSDSSGEGWFHAFDGRRGFNHGRLPSLLL